MKLFWHQWSALKCIGYLIASGLLSHQHVWADSGESADAAPSAELLEFLTEFTEMDDETFELILHHGKQDSKLEEIEKMIGREGQEESKGESHDEV